MNLQHIPLVATLLVAPMFAGGAAAAVTETETECLPSQSTWVVCAEAMAWAHGMADVVRGRVSGDAETDNAVLVEGTFDTSHWGIKHCLELWQCGYDSPDKDVSAPCGTYVKFSIQTIAEAGGLIAYAYAEAEDRTSDC